jgi:hypothetical protein
MFSYGRPNQFVLFGEQNFFQGPLAAGILDTIHAIENIFKAQSSVNPEILVCSGRAGCATDALVVEMQACVWEIISTLTLSSLAVKVSGIQVLVDLLNNSKPSVSLS